MGGCFKSIFGLVVIAIILGVVVIHFSPQTSGTSSTPPAPSNPVPPVAETPRPPTPDIVSTPPDPVAQAPVPVIPRRSLAELQRDYDDAKAAAIERVKLRPEYQQAKAPSDNAMAKLEVARRSDDRDEIAAASAAYVRSHAAAVKMEVEAVESDHATFAAKTALQAEKDRLKQEEEQRLAAIRDQQQKAEEVARAERERQENDPIYQAINGHRLIEGMTYEQAVEAIGRPYSITTSGGYRECTWQNGSGNFWSASFVDGKIVVVSHTRI